MLKCALLLLLLSGLQAAPIAAPSEQLPGGFRQGTEDSRPTPGKIPGDFRQGTEPSRRFVVDLSTGRVKEQVSEMQRRADIVLTAAGRGFGEMDRRHWLPDDVTNDAVLQRKTGGWIRVEESSASYLPDGFRQGTEPSRSMPNGFRQGTEPMMSSPESFNQEMVPLMDIPEGFRQGTEPHEQLSAWFRQGTELRKLIPEGFRQGTEPIMSSVDVFRQGTEPLRPVPEGLRHGMEPHKSLSEGFRQGTEPSRSVRGGFRQGTEPMMSIPENFNQEMEPIMDVLKEPVGSIPDGFRQGTEPIMSSVHVFRQGTEPLRSIPEEFRQGASPVGSIPEGFRQGTEPHMSIPEGFRQGTEPLRSILEGFRQGTEPIEVKSFQGLQQGAESSVKCEGQVINGNCYEFNPTPMTFRDAQERCRVRAPSAQLTSITSQDLHSRLVSLVTTQSEDVTPRTWLGGTVENQQASWVDGSEWVYSDWMPGQPNIHTDKAVCVEMFHTGESWWTAADCELKRASLCSYPMSA